MNSYVDVAICLPFRTESITDTSYIAFLLIINLILFLFVCSSYVRMFWVVRSPHLDGGPQRNDSEVAKRMALLVFTDFFCWGPIAFVGLISAFGGADILGVTVKNSKFLLVVFFPINSLCNPFLYSVSTNSFKRDFYDLLIRCGLCQECVTRANEGMFTHSSSYKQSTIETFRSTISRQSTSERWNLLGRVLTKRLKMEKNVKSTTPTLSMKSTPRTPIIDDDVFEKETDSPLINRIQISPSDKAFSMKDSNENKKNNNYSTNTNSSIENDDEESPLNKLQKDCLQYDLSPEAFRRAKETTNI